MNFPENKLKGIKLNAITVEDTEKQLNKILLKHSELFNDEIGCVTHYTHKITKNSGRPFKAKTYPVPEIHRCRVKENLLTL